MTKKALLTVGLASILTAVSCSKGGVKVGYNVFGTGGSAALDSLAAQTKYVFETLGDSATVKDENWNADNLTPDIDDLIGSGCKGINIWGISPFFIKDLAEKCNNAKVYFTLNDKVPTDPEVIASIKKMEYFAGAVAPKNSLYGEEVAKFAIEQGYTKVLIVCPNDGEDDSSDGPRIKKFKEIWDATGGGRTEVADLVTCEQPNLAKANIASALAKLKSNVPNFIYGTSSDYAMAAIEALNEAGNEFKDVKVITSGLEKTILDNQNADGSRVVFVNGDAWVSGYFSAVLLHNAVNGNVIKDSSGNKVWNEDIKPFTITNENYADYKRYFIDEQIYTADETKAFGNTNYETITSAISDYSFTSRINAKKK